MRPLFLFLPNCSVFLSERPMGGQPKSKASSWSSSEVGRLWEQARQFLASQCFSRLQRHPLRPRQVRRRNNVLPLRQFRKFLRRSFERQPHRGRLERRHRVHSSAHLKQEVAAPLNLLGGSW